MCPEQQEASLSPEGELAPLESVGGSERMFTFSTISPSHSSRENVIALKFGGSSLAGAERMLHSAGLVGETTLRSRVCVVVSAMRGVTDRLLAVAQLLVKKETQRARREAEGIAALHLETLHELKLAEREQARVEHELELLSRDLLHETPARGRVEVNDAVCDRLASFGERYAARLFAAALGKIGVRAVPVASSDFVLTCDNFRDAKPHLEHTERRGREILLPLLDAGIVPVVTGFIGATQDGRITTLGRNSSDFSGALVAHVVEAEELVIWTDVDGIYTANPHESAEARLFYELSYDEAHALAANGAKVLHPNVLPLAAQTEMTVWVRNTFKPHARGTRIGSQQNGGVA
jgi:bifunctional aspartokinase / homoserine dehydrogenase 1